MRTTEQNSVLPIDKAKQLIKSYNGIQGADKFLRDLLFILVFDTQSVSSVSDLIDYYTEVQQEVRKIQIWNEVLDMRDDTIGKEPIEYTEEQKLEMLYDEQRIQQQLD